MGVGVSVVASERCEAVTTSAVAGVVGDEERLLLILQWLDAHRK